MTEEVAAEATTVESGAAEEVEENGTGAGAAEVEAPAAEAVEIPKQQSAEQAADSEAGEGART
ncbi:gliding motility protein [Streptomyces sp. NPDC002467]|uniref:gliding motility protein n=1 Tax=Streptomyces sp. NPDC002467 TaxID=3364647 RepID=UPI0036B32FAE